MPWSFKGAGVFDRAAEVARYRNGLPGADVELDLEGRAGTDARQEGVDEQGAQRVIEIIGGEAESARRADARLHRGVAVRTGYAHAALRIVEKQRQAGQRQVGGRGSEFHLHFHRSLRRTRAHPDPTVSRAAVAVERVAVVARLAEIEVDDAVGRTPPARSASSPSAVAVAASVAVWVAGGGAVFVLVGVPLGSAVMRGGRRRGGGGGRRRDDGVDGVAVGDGAPALRSASRSPAQGRRRVRC
jgi:hypothetical protein